MEPEEGGDGGLARAVSTSSTTPPACLPDRGSCVDLASAWRTCTRSGEPVGVPRGERVWRPQGSVEAWESSIGSNIPERPYPRRPLARGFAK